MFAVVGAACGKKKASAKIVLPRQQVSVHFDLQLTLLRAMASPFSPESGLPGASKFPTNAEEENSCGSAGKTHFIQPQVSSCKRGQDSHVGK